MRGFQSRRAHNFRLTAAPVRSLGPAGRGVFGVPGPNAAGCRGVTGLRGDGSRITDRWAAGAQNRRHGPTAGTARRGGGRQVRAAAGHPGKQGGHPRPEPPRPVYDTTGIAIPDRLGHAPSNVTRAFAGVWAAEE
ncbi:conserved protein of unknown function [Streptomyces sp. KY75]|nr:conserved protein of unknown function [Streptomyces sp. KY75]CAD5983818.1 conserved protein of unknown function [Streptomyces sp. KY70]